MMALKDRSPSELRGMLGRNLRKLVEREPSIIGVARALGINRTQFNRYLSGESFPRPDMLAKICDYFQTDARILLEPLGGNNDEKDPFQSSFLRGFFGGDISFVPEDLFPSGFYRYTRQAFMSKDRFVVGLVNVLRLDGSTYFRGYEARAAMRGLGLPVSRDSREYRGLVFRQEDGVAGISAGRNSRRATFNFLARMPSHGKMTWLGYAARFERENTVDQRAVRMVYEFIGSNAREALGAERPNGFLPVEKVKPALLRMLLPDEPFR